MSDKIDTEEDSRKITIEIYLDRRRLRRLKSEGDEKCSVESRLRENALAKCQQDSWNEAMVMKGKKI